MSYQFVKIISLSILIFGALLAPSLVSADVLEDAISGVEKTAEKADLEIDQSGDIINIIGRGINSVLGIMGVIAVVLIVYAGGLWLTAAGSDEKVKQAKKIIRTTVVGLLILGFAYGITTFIIALAVGA